MEGSKEEEEEEADLIGFSFSPFGCSLLPPPLPLPPPLNKIAIKAQF